MRNISTISIPQLTNWVIFEKLCYDLWKNDSNNDIVYLNGRNGQNQDGVDIFGRIVNTKQWFGIQCKLRKNKNSISRNELIQDFDKAANFVPAIFRLIICTTLRRDAELQKYIRLLNESSKYNYEIEIIFWEDIEELLRKEINFNIFAEYYNGLIVDNTSLGHAIGKLINIDLGENGKYDTHYEIMIGKIPPHINKEYNAVNSYKGRYFIMNLREGGSATFNIPIWEGEIEDIFLTRYDEFRISKWINSIEKLEDFIYENKQDYSSFIDPKEKQEFLRKYKRND